MLRGDGRPWTPVATKLEGMAYTLHPSSFLSHCRASWRDNVRRMTSHHVREGGSIGNAWMETRRVQSHEAPCDTNGIRRLAHRQRQAGAARSIAKYQSALVLRGDARAAAVVRGRAQRVSPARDI